MATTNYLKFRQKVRDWSNRDAGALPDAVIDDAINFAEDEALRRLKIPPLEQNQYYYIFKTVQATELTAAANDGQTVTIDDPGNISTADDITASVAVWNSIMGDNTVTAANIAGVSGVLSFTIAFTTGYTIPTGFTGSVSEGTVPADVAIKYPNAFGVITYDISNTVAFGGEELRLPVPADTTTFIQLRVAQATTSNQSLGVVFNEKVDIRTYYDSTAHIRNQNRWMRQGSNLHVVGEYMPGDVIELYYYRRPPNANARYDVDADSIANYNLGSRGFIAPVADLLEVGSSASLGEEVRNAAGDAVFISLVDNNTEAPSTSATNWATVPVSSLVENTAPFFYGLEVFNWLRDENVRVLLFGALYQSFDYLADHEMKGNFFEKFAKTIEELNEEEKKRTASGGNVQMNYSGYLLSNYLL